MAAHPPRLSAHATTRYVQRFLGIDLRLDEDFFGGFFVAGLHRYASGLSWAQIEDLVLTSTVRQAMAAGVTRIKFEGVWLAFGTNNTVVTIGETSERQGWKPPKQAGHILSKRERHRLQRQGITRRKHRPVSA